MEKLIIHCPTQELYNKIVEKIGWYDGAQKTNYWKSYREAFYTKMLDGKLCSYGSKADYSDYPSHLFITAEKYLANNSNIKEKTMTIKEKFVLALTKEPQKSFRKAGITNGDDLLTEEGGKIFLTWLLNKNADDFKKEVVDGLLADNKGE